MGKTISFVKGRGHISHNNRDFISNNVVPERTDWNRTYVKESIESAYDTCFGQALNDYNARQKRKDRQKHDYITEIRNSKNKEKVFYENVVQIGSKNDTAVADGKGCMTEEAEKAAKVLEKYAQTFQERNPNLYLFNCVLHMDEKTPHLHATVVPIVTGERIRRKREGEKKYETKSGPRLSADDVMRRTKLHEYQNSYAKAMKPFGLQRGIVGSTAKHQVNSEYYRQQVIQYEEDIAKLQADVEKAQEGRNTILAWFGKGDLSKAKKELADKDRLIAELNKQIEELQAEKARLQEQHKSEIGKLRNGYQKEIDKAIHQAEAAERQFKEKDALIDRQRKQISLLDRKANPQRYSLSSGAELVRINVSNYRNPSLHIWTRVGDELFENIKFQIDYDVAQSHFNGQITDEEFVNAVFDPQEQVNGKQAELLGAVFTLAAGGPAEVHVGTGSGGLIV